MAAALTVLLEHSSHYRCIQLAEPLNPRSWVLAAPNGQLLPLADPANAARFFPDAEASCGTSRDDIYISFDQDEDGRHRFVCLGEAALRLEQQRGQGTDAAPAAAPLAVRSEAEVKRLREENRATLLYARRASMDPTPGRTSTGAGVAAAPRRLSAAEEAAARADDLCPHGIFSNYSIVPDLSLGRTNKLILCDEATLTRELPQERIFEYLTLIVNCHENRVSPGKYRVGACAREPRPHVICQAVHEWFGNDGMRMNKINDEMQEKIWEHLQSGSVAVHCLAGIHRAACIVACHFLWRFYAMGHTEIPCDAVVIYRKLKAVRPAVSPAYTHVLQSYENYLKRRGPTASAPR